MTPVVFNNINNPLFKCYAVYDNPETRYIERSLIVSDILTSTEGIDFIHVDNFTKRVLLSNIKDIVVTRIKHITLDSMNRVDLSKLPTPTE